MMLHVGHRPCGPACRQIDLARQQRSIHLHPKVLYTRVNDNPLSGRISMIDTQQRFILMGRGCQNLAGCIQN